MSFIGVIIVGIICGFITKAINNSKGRDGGFAWGFFLGLIGIIIVALRPSVNVSSSSVAMWSCPQCGERNPMDGNFCRKCGTKK